MHLPYWRVWVEGGDVRVARDRHDGEPEHLEIVDGGHVAWRSHSEGAFLPSISLPEFVAWLDQGGADA